MTSSNTAASEAKNHLLRLCDQIDRSGLLDRFRTRFRLIPLPAAITLSLVLVGCGDDDKPGQGEVCNDGIDNDGDKAIDCQDGECANFPNCLPTPYSAPFEFC